MPEPRGRAMNASVDDDGAHPRADGRDFAEARPGDWIVSPAPGGGSPRRGLITEVLGARSHRRFRIRWDEQHESLHYPAPDERLVRHDPVDR